MLDYMCTSSHLILIISKVVNQFFALLICRVWNEQDKLTQLNAESNRHVELSGQPGVTTPSYYGPGRAVSTQLLVVNGGWREENLDIRETRNVRKRT